ncbi:amino acid ABC transporter permease [Castellaniella sp. MT123]|uniref:amino acid ABC transporter permease n=1 Tax=Castellaniella sp. MT123 TaxID=3140381 RepID=UPI0031F464BC
MTARFLTLCRKNLFPSWFEGLLSLLILAGIAVLVYALAHWAIVQAQWSVIGGSLRFLMAGTLDLTELWRAWLASGIFCLLVGISLARITRARAIKGLLAAGAISLAAAAILWGIGDPVAARVAALLLAAVVGALIGARLPWRSSWLSLIWVAGVVLMWQLLVLDAGHAVGGLLLGVLVTLVAAIVSFPLGILLALGRTSRLPGVRWVSTAYIELIRSLPLISILYWAWMVVPLILASDVRISDVVRGTIGITLFYAAYVAEYVRGGLQAVPEGQWHAARSLGLRKTDILIQIVLPQAIRTVLPGLVGNVLDIFNNVPLLFIIGLTEFVRAGQVVLANPQFSDQIYEVYAFMFVVYLIIATVLTWSSRVVERTMGPGG